MSVTGTGSATSLTFLSLMPPEPAVGSLSHYRYRLRLRAANSSTTSPNTVQVTVTQGAYSWTDSMSVPSIANLDEYVVTDSTNGIYSTNPLTLASGAAFSVVLAIPAGSSAWAFDDFILESEGIPR